MSLSQAAEDPVILETNTTLSGIADTFLFGQTFTVSDPVEISSVEVFVKREYGGSSFQLILQPYDPWTSTRGEPIASVAVSLDNIPAAPEGGWMSIPLSSAAVLSNPGVYGVFLDTDSNGYPEGFNSYGYSEGDSVSGGRVVSPNFTREVEMMLRLRGTADFSAFAPPNYAIPKFTSLTSEKRATVGGAFTFIRVTWNTQSGAAYRVLKSNDLIQWRETSIVRLGDGAETSYEFSDRFDSRQFIKVEVLPLGDFDP